MSAQHKRAVRERIVNHPQRHATAPLPTRQTRNSRPRDGLAETRRILSCLWRGGNIVFNRARGKWQLVSAAGRRTNLKRKHLLMAFRGLLIYFSFKLRRFLLARDGAATLAAIGVAR